MESDVFVGKFLGTKHSLWSGAFVLRVGRDVTFRGSTGAGHRGNGMGSAGRGCSRNSSSALCIRTGRTCF